MSNILLNWDGHDVLRRLVPIRSGGSVLTHVSCSTSGIFALCCDLTRHTSYITRHADGVNE